MAHEQVMKVWAVMGITKMWKHGNNRSGIEEGGKETWNMAKTSMGSYEMSKHKNENGETEEGEIVFVLAAFG